MLKRIHHAVSNLKQNWGYFYYKNTTVLLLIFLVGCNDPASEEDTEKKGTASCGVKASGSLKVGETFVADLTCNLPDFYQGKELKISYDRSFASLELVASDKEIVGEKGSLAHTLPEKEEFEAKLKLTGIKAGKSKVNFKILSQESDWDLTIASVPPTWTQETASAKWSARNSHTSVVFNNKIWVLGGNSGRFIIRPSNHYKNDVWSSPDGKNWTQETASAKWSARNSHTSVVFKDKMWVLGGENNQDDVWSSSDGKNWTKVTDSPGWDGRYAHTSVVFKDKIWVIGGAYLCCDDVWSSPDGKNWTEVADSVAWSYRYAHTSVVFKDKIWVIGGYDGSAKPYHKSQNDVWSSSDGKKWTKVTDSPGWSARINPTSVVFNNNMWVIGGYDGTKTIDVWSSPDGKTWTQETASADLSNRVAHTSIVFNGKIWALGGAKSLGIGRGTSNINDVWSYGR